MEVGMCWSNKFSPPEEHGIALPVALFPLQQSYSAMRWWSLKWEPWWKGSCIPRARRGVLGGVFYGRGEEVHQLGLQPAPQPPVAKSTMGRTCNSLRANQKAKKHTHIMLSQLPLVPHFKIFLMLWFLFWGMYEMVQLIKRKKLYICLEAIMKDFWIFFFPPFCTNTKWYQKVFLKKTVSNSVNVVECWVSSQSFMFFTQPVKDATANCKNRESVSKENMLIIHITWSYSVLHAVCFYYQLLGIKQRRESTAKAQCACIT